MDRRLTRIAVGGLCVALALACTGGPESPEVPERPAPAPVEEEPMPEEAPPVRSPLPLATGHTWVYEVRERKGAGARIFLIPTKKAENRKIADWTFTIGEADGEGFAAKLTRVPVGDELPSTTEMRLWAQDGEVWMDAGKGGRPALAALLPPDPVSAERVRCVAHALGGVVGTCAPVFGGPLGTAPGLHRGVVAEDIKQGAEVGQFLVGLVSVGLFIPGNQSTVQSATLASFTPGPGTEALFAAGPGSAVENAAAAVATASDEAVIATAERGMAKLPEGARYPVVRTAIPLAREGGLVALARLRAQLPAETPDAHREAILALFEVEEEREQADLLLDGEPLFTAVVAGTDGPFDANRMRALEDALAVHPVTPEGAVAVVGLFQFDDGRRDAIERLLPGIPEDQRADVLAEMFEALAFDEARIALIRDHADLLRTLPEPRRRTLVRKVAFQGDEARALLLE